MTRALTLFFAFPSSRAANVSTLVILSFNSLLVTCIYAQTDKLSTFIVSMRKSLFISPSLDKSPSLRPSFSLPQFAFRAS